MIISLAMALVAKSYVIEAFVIPTGSMAPTLLGQNIRFQSPESGYSWAVNPWLLASRDQAAKVQWLGEELGPQVTDPMSTSRFNPWTRRQRPDSRIHGYTLPLEPKRPGAGDRILVQKYLYEISPPTRFDVVVFKNPENSSENFIKRLIGLPNEQIWIVDGDIFARPLKDGQPAGEWAIARKPSRIQKSLWRALYSSEYAPLDNIRTGGNANHFTSPWNGTGWNTGKERTYTCSTADPTALAWDTDKWPIWDWVPYNESPEVYNGFDRAIFNVSDVRVRAGVRADQDGLIASATITAHGHEFRALLENRRAKLQVRATTAEGAIAAEWKTLDDQSFDGFTPGRVVNVEFWRVDQTLQLWLDGNRVCNAEYNWSPEERLANVLGVPFSDIPRKGQPNWTKWLADPSNYHAARCGVRWEFKGSPLSLERVGLDRDVFYEPGALGSTAALGTHPDSLPSLNGDQFFVCGDNSPSSKDARLWTTVDPWIADQIDPTVGVVNRKLMMGKAFYVYFPAMHTALGSIPVPDFGRMRFIK